MNTPNLTDITSIFVFMKDNILLDGASTIFFDILMLPVFFIILVSCRNMNVGDNMDCLNISSFICLILSFILSSVQMCSFIIVGTFLGLMMVGLLFKRIT